MAQLIRFCLFVVVSVWPMPGATGCNNTGWRSQLRAKKKANELGALTQKKRHHTHRLHYYTDNALVYMPSRVLVCLFGPPRPLSFCQSNTTSLPPKLAMSLARIHVDSTRPLTFTHTPPPHEAQALPTHEDNKTKHHHLPFLCFVAWGCFPPSSASSPALMPPSHILVSTLTQFTHTHTYTHHTVHYWPCRALPPHQ